MSAGYIIYSLDWNKFQQLVQRPTADQLAALAELLSGGLEEYDGEFDEDDPLSDWPTDAASLSPIVAQRLALPDWYGDLSGAGKAVWEGVIFDACMNCDEIDVGFRADNDGVYWDVIEIAWKQLGVVPNVITEVALSAFGTRPYRYHPPNKSAKTRAEFDQEDAGRKASLGALGTMLGKFLEGAKRGEKAPDKLLEEIEDNEAVSAEHKGLLKDFFSDDDDDGEDDEDDGYEWSPMHSMHTPAEVEKMRAELKSIEPAMKATKKKDARRDFEEELLPSIETIASEGRMLFIQVDT